MPLSSPQGGKEMFPSEEFFASGAPPEADAPIEQYPTEPSLEAVFQFLNTQAAHVQKLVIPLKTFASDAWNWAKWSGAETDVKPVESSPETPDIAFEEPAFEETDIHFLEPAFAQVAQATEAAVQAIVHAETAASGDPTAHAELAALATETLAITTETLRKVGDQLGSNRGGWYEDAKTKDRYYVKQYDDADQARVEFIANAIYEKLGIRAVRSELFEMDGQLAIASRAIPDASSSMADDQRASPDVRGGFIADAYLANWDVIGLVHDNVVRGSDGRHYRIDNGGSLVFRAQGEAKAYAADAIPEIDTMRNPQYPGGRVFSDLTEQELAQQAKDLLRALSPEDIEEIVMRSGMTGTAADTVRDGLLGRRAYLLERFQLSDPIEQHNPGKRIAISMERLRSESERLRNVELLARTAILADHDKIENQQIDIIEEPTKYVVTFKLTASAEQAVRERLSKANANGERWLRRGRVIYRSNSKALADGEDNAFHFSDGWEIGGPKLRILVTNDHFQRSGIGLVRMEVLKQDQKTGETITADRLAQRVDRAMRKIFAVEDGIAPPEKNAEREYKWQRYAWHHKIDPTNRPPDWEAVEERLQRKEVFPGYFTFVDSERSRAYGEQSPYTLYHAVQHRDLIPKLLATGGLLSTHERYRRGLILSGQSSSEDMVSGGADSVFARIATESGLQNGYGTNRHISGMSIVFSPTLLNRTDWYAYGDDQYGKTDPPTFAKRKAPMEILESERSNWHANNELMFRLGIAVQDMAAIAIPQTDNWQSDLRTKFEQYNIREINGIPAETLITQGATAVRRACEAARITNLGGKSIEAFMRESVSTNVRSIVDMLTVEDYHAIRQAGLSDTKEDLLTLDINDLADTLHKAGLDVLGGHPPEWFLHNGERVQLANDVESMLDLDEIDGMNTYDFITTQPEEVVARALRDRTVFRIGARNVQKLIQQAKTWTMRDLVNVMLKDDVTAKLHMSFSDFEQLPLDEVVAVLQKSGITELGGIRVASLPIGDERDRILELLEQQGVREINGKPAHEFIVYAKTYGDLVDIANGRPPRSLASPVQDPHRW